MYITITDAVCGHDLFGSSAPLHRQWRWLCGNGRGPQKIATIWIWGLHDGRKTGEMAAGLLFRFRITGLLDRWLTITGLLYAHELIIVPLPLIQVKKMAVQGWGRASEEINNR